MRIDLQTQPFSLLGETDFVIAAWTADPPRTDTAEWQAPLHRHRTCDEAWYILDGKLGFLVDGETYDAPTGSLVYVKKGQVHTYWNASKGETRYLIFLTRNVKSLVDAIHSSPDKSPAALKAIFDQYDSELLG